MGQGQGQVQQYGMTAGQGQAQQGQCMGQQKGQQQGKEGHMHTARMGGIGAHSPSYSPTPYSAMPPPPHSQFIYQPSSPVYNKHKSLM
jgi:hypothetical protein